MPERVQTLRSSTKGARPTGRQPGELYTNFADRQIGVVNASNVATDLVAVRYFSTAADYAIGDYAVQAGQLYRAKAAITAGAFSAAQWDLIYGKDAVDALLGGKANTTHGHAQSDIANLVTDLALKAPLADPAFTGNPTAPTPAVGDNDTSVATTQFVTRADTTAPVVPKPTTFGLVDWNTITTPGWHSALIQGHYASGTNAPPTPTASYFYCQVLDFTNLTQIAYPYSDPASAALNMGIWYRGRFSGVWSAWRQLAPATAEARNRIVNPAFQISQENSSTSSSVILYYAADQWNHYYQGTGVSLTLTSIRTPGENYLSQASGLVKASLAATDLAFVQQILEASRITDFAYGTASSKRGVLYLKMAAITAGTYAVVLQGGGLSFVKSITFPAASIDTTFVIPVPPCTTGSWPTGNAGALTLMIAMGVGSNYLTPNDGVWQAGDFRGITGMTNGLASSNVFFIKQVGFYRDPDNTGLAPPFQMPDEAEELRACRRYYAKYEFNFIVSSYTSASQTIFGAVQFQTQMRIAPAVTNSIVTYLNGVNWSWNAISMDGCRGVFSSSVAGPAYALIGILYCNSRL